MGLANFDKLQLIESHNHLRDMAGKNDKQFSVVPSELRLSQKWDYAVENFITRPFVGLACAGLISVVLFSK